MQNMEDWEQNVIYIDFLDCFPGKEYVKYLDVPSAQEILSIDHKQISNILEKVFSIEENKTKVNRLKISYKALSANVSHNDTYHIVTNHEVKILYLSGRTLDVKVVCKTKSLYFDCVNFEPIKRSINLTNESKVDTLFQFENDSEHSGIDISPSIGSIRKKETVKIIFTLTPRRSGFAYKKIYCLVLWHEPLIFEIRSKCNIYSGSSEFSDFIYTNECLKKPISGYEDYVQDLAVQNKAEYHPILHIDRKYIDFGYRDLSKGPVTPFRVFRITNNALINCVVTWESEQSETFHIKPIRWTIQSNSSHTFTVSFEPSKPNMMYSAKIFASINWGTNNDFVMPCHLSVSFLGHTLLNQRSSWDQFYKIESNHTVLPATVPNHPTSKTFILTNAGTLPMMFKFLSPYDSGFTVKPLQGIVMNDFQIIIIRLLPGVEVGQIYSEEWLLELNGYSVVKIQFSASAELPFLHIADNNKITFPTTNIHSKVSIPVPITNTTRLIIKFKIATDEGQKTFFPEKNENIINPNQQYNINVFFQPHTLGKQFLTTFCEMTLIKPNIPEIHVKSVVMLEGISSKCNLIAYPNSLQYDNVILRNWEYSCFFITNESDCTAHGKLYVVNYDKCDSPLTYKVKPELLTLKEKESREIQVGVCPNIDGLEKIYVYYELYENAQFEEKISQFEPQKLLDIDVYCDKPELRIADIYLNRSGENIAKLQCWEMLKINELNKIFKRIITRPEVPPLNIKLPAFEEGSSQFYVELLVENRSPFGAEISIIYEKICSCECMLEDHGLSIRKLKASCDHKKQITFSMKKSIFQPNEQGIIEIHNNYTTSDTSLFKFILTITSTDDPRLTGSVNLFIERHCIKKNSGFLDFYHSTLNNSVEMKLDPVFISDHCKPIQVIWIYNNSPKDVKYNIEIENNPGNIFHFLNVKSRVSPKTMHPLLIKFTPYEFINYTIKVNFITKYRTLNLKIEGVGKITPCYNTKSMSGGMPLFSRFDSKINLLTSVDHILINPRIVHSTIKRLVFIQNNTNARIKFCWVEKRLGSLLEIKSVPTSGILDPKETSVCQILIKTLSTAARFSVNFTCKFIYLDAKELYDTRVKGFRSDARIFDATFRIDEKNEYSPIPPKSFIGERSVSDYINLTVSVHILSEKNLNGVLPDLEDQIKSINQRKIPLHPNKLSLTNKEANVVIDVLSRITWEVLHKKSFLHSISLPPQIIYYRDILKTEGETPMRHPPNKLILNVLNAMSCNVFSEVLHVKPQWRHDLYATESKISKASSPNIFQLNNLFYSDILNKGVHNVMSVYSDRDIKERRKSEAVRPTKTNFSDWQLRDRLK